MAGREGTPASGSTAIPRRLLSGQRMHMHAQALGGFSRPAEPKCRLPSQNNRGGAGSWPAGTKARAGNPASIPYLPIT